MYDSLGKSNIYQNKKGINVHKEFVETIKNYL